MGRVCRCAALRARGWEAELGRLRLGMIGCGNIAKSSHLPAIAYLNGEAELVATADISAADAEAAAQPWGATAYTDYRQLIDRNDIDAVIIATPEFLHKEQVVAAAEAGLHVLCEKPMCRSVDEADVMIEACARNDVRLLIGHSRRYTRRYAEVRRELDEGLVGDIRLARENERRATTHMSRMGQKGTRWTPRHWTGNPEIGMGVTLSHGVHEIDLLRWFTGSQVTTAFAEQAVVTPGNVGVPDFVSFVLTFANGAIGSAEISYSLPAAYPANHNLELYGSEGMIRAKDHDLVGLTTYRDDIARHPGVYDRIMHERSAYVRQLADLLGAIRGDHELSMQPSEARAALDVALALIASARSGKVISLGAAA